VDNLFEKFAERCGSHGVVSAAGALLADLRAQGDPGAGAWRHLAEQLIRAGYPQVAAQVLTAAIERCALAPELHYWRGNALRLDGRHAEAERDFRTALAAVPGHCDAAFSLAHMLREDGRLLAAVDTVKASLRARADDQAHALDGLVFLRECGAHAQGRAPATWARQRWPASADIAALDGEFALATGEFEHAAAALRAALDLNPRDGMSMLRLAHCQHFTNPDAMDLRRIERAWQDRLLDDDTRLQAGFAFGKALDDLDDFAAAADVLRQANAAASKRAAWRAEDWQAFVERRLAAADLPRTDGFRGYVPIFVVGLPRTGTTLVASLLARDGQVRNRGELNWLDAMYRALDAQGRLRDRVALSSAAHFIDAQLRRDDPPAFWYLDKNPLNFRYLDLIAALFPDARIIHCRRDPRDTALSLWRQHFAHADLGFSYDFSSIAAFMDGHDRIVAHRRNALPLAFFDLEYEALVKEPDAVLERLRGFLGLHEKGLTKGDPDAQVVTTASVWQVRQPVYTSSIGRWVEYAGHLPELTSMF
jgi:tetratricopeptide (TPR) repeat protein